MLQTFTPRPPRNSLFPKENSFPRPNYKNTYNQHILNLNITQDIPTPNKYKTIDTNYKTAYNYTNVSWKAAHMRHVNRAEAGGTEHAHGHSVVGTPFTCVQFAENQSGSGMFLTERQHYRYLVKAISGLRRGKHLYDHHKYKDLHNPEHYRSIFSHDAKPNRYAAGYGATGNSSFHNANEPKNVDNGIFTSPKIVNISAQIKSRKGVRSSLDSKENPFQNIFKNKRRLQSKYYDGKADAYQEFEVGILGEGELQIHQVARTRTRKHQKRS